MPNGLSIVGIGTAFSRSDALEDDIVEYATLGSPRMRYFRRNASISRSVFPDVEKKVVCNATSKSQLNGYAEDVALGQPEKI
jgi:hypothetical protein